MLWTRLCCALGSSPSSSPDAGEYELETQTITLDANRSSRLQEQLQEHRQQQHVSRRSGVTRAETYRAARHHQSTASQIESGIEQRSRHAFRTPTPTRPSLNDDADNWSTRAMQGSLSRYLGAARMLLPNRSAHVATAGVHSSSQPVWALSLRQTADSAACGTNLNITSCDRFVPLFNFFPSEQYDLGLRKGDRLRQ